MKFRYIYPETDEPAIGKFGKDPPIPFEGQCQAVESCCRGDSMYLMVHWNEQCKNEGIRWRNDGKWVCKKHKKDLEMEIPRCSKCGRKL